MNEKIKKTFRAMTSAALAGAFVVSSVIGGGADSFVSSSVAFAEETDSTSSVAERTAAAKERYLSKLAEAQALSADDYSADSYSLFLDRLAPYNKSLIIEMDSESYSDIEYRTLYDGIEYAESFLVADTSHSYLSDLEKLINYGNSLVKDDYTDESFTAFKTKFDSLASGNYSLEKAKAAEEDGYGGKTIYTSYIEKQYIPCFNLLKSRDCCSVTLVDPNTGITVSSDSDVIPQDAELVVTAYDSTDWPWLTLNSNSFTNIPRLCSQYVYYNVAIYGSDGKRINISSPYTITYPISDNFDMSQLTYQLYTNEIGSGSIAKIKKDIDNKTISVTFRQTSMSKANGSAMLFKNAISNVDPLTLEDGIYNVKANLTASADATRASMSNEAIIHDAYLTKLGDDINIYVNFVPIYVIAPDQPSYCGGLWSEKGKQRDSQYYEDSEVVYSYYTNEDGTIRDNDIYNGVTQIPCPKTIKLHLERDSFNEYGGYTLVVSSPAMAALNKLDFSEIEKYWDELTAIMMISNPTYLGTIEEASSYLPTYDITALQREYEYAIILADDNIYTDESWADVQALLDTETTTEDKKCVTGYSDTAELTARIAEYQSATAALVVDESKKMTAKVTGYSLTAKEDFGLHLFVSLSSDARNDANAAVKFNIGGTEQTIAVSDATFAEGKGYEFVLDVPAKKMYDDITAEIVLSDGAEVIGDANLGTYSVAGYLNDYLADPTKTELDALAQATLTYGAYADKFFNGSTDAELADVSAVTIDDVAQYKHNINVTEEGIDFVGAALTLESKTSVKLYFKVDEENLYDITDFAFTVNGNKAEPERNGDYYYITVPKLTAGELAKAQTFTVNDAEFSYSPFSYVYAALADSDAEKEADLINLVKALYLYGVEAGKVA